MRILRNTLPIVISAAILFFIAKEFNFFTLTILYSDINYYYLAISIILLLTVPLILTIRWHTCLHSLQHYLTYGQIIPAYLASIPIAKLSPGNLGDMIRSVLLPNVQRSTLVGIVIFENLLDLLALCLITLIGGVFTMNNSAIVVSLVLLASIILTAYFLPRLPVPIRWRDKLTGALSLPLTLFRRRDLVLRTLALSIIAWLIVLGFLALAFLSFGTHPPLGTLITRQPLIILAGILPLSFSGVGVRETGMLAAYQGLAPDSTILAVALTHSFFGIVVLPLLCLPWTIIALKRFRYGKA